MCWMAKVYQYQCWGEGYLIIVLLMRIFISVLDESGTKRTTRINISNCTSTTNLIKEICKEIKIAKTNLIIKIKHDNQNLRLIDNWPIDHYPIRNGSVFLIEKMESGQRKQSVEYEEELEKIQELDDSIEEETMGELSFLNYADDAKYSAYFQECLNKMLAAVRTQSLEQISAILNELPECPTEEELNRVMGKKLKYLLNQTGQCGRTALHWAIHINSPDMVSFLIIKGANPTILTIDNYTPLQLAVLHHSPEIMRLLIEQKKIDINQATKCGTALHLAVANEDKRCVQVLLQNDVDIETLDSQGKTALQICKNPQIRALLEKRTQIKQLPKPNISKGKIYKITSVTYRSKEKSLLINPFKNEFIIYNTENQVQLQQNITNISDIDVVEEKSWLMSSKMHYFRIRLLGSEEKEDILFGLKNIKIYKKWIGSFELALKYTLNISLIRAVPASEQLIQVLDDQTGETTTYKRKVDNPSLSPSKKNISIMNLKVEPQRDATQFSKKSGLKKTHQGSSSIASSQNELKQSQIILGSVLQSKTSTSSVASELNSEDSFSPLLNERSKSEQASPSITQYKFRKNSDQKVQIVSQFKVGEKMKVSFEDFIIQKELGSGAFGHVYLAKFKKNGKFYALKVLNKKKLVSKKHLKYAVGEANILKKMDSPFIVKLYFAFQTPTNLYMALDNCSRGDLSQIITCRQKLPENTARFIVAQLILAIQYLHDKKILYRDLKPENILIASDGYIRLTDFGLSRENSFSMSFCGSPAYLSPEMLQKKGVGFSTDIYGIGCVLYEMLVGEPPYFDQNLDSLLQNIKAGKLRYPSYLTLQAKSLLGKLLERDLNKRIGVKDYNQIKRHDFFKKMDWTLLANKKIKPPKQLEGDNDANFFETYNLESTQEIKLVDYDYSQMTTMINRVKNFTFVHEQQAQSLSLHKTI